MRRVHESRRRVGERGSAILEAVIGIPLFLLLVALAVFGGRVALTHQAVQTAAADAARAASIARTATQARTDGLHAATASLTNQAVHCVTSTVSVDVTGFATPVGTPAQVSATVACSVALSDLGLPGGGPRLVSATMSSPLDSYRGR